MKINPDEPMLAKVKAVEPLAGSNNFVVRFVYYATQKLRGAITYEEVVIEPDHPLAAELKTLQHGDELYAIPTTNNIVQTYPHNWFIRFILRQGML